MKSTKILVILVLALGLMVWMVKVSEAVPIGTGFTYQGRLIDADSVANGLYDFQFELYSDPCLSFAVYKVGDTITIDELDVIDGYFTVELDFGNAGIFTGDARWLDIGVRPGEQSDPCEYTILQPRQEVTPTPYALYAKTTGGGNDWMVADNNIYSVPSGNVGIGTTNPGAKLEVKQANWADIVKVGTSLTSNRLILSSGTQWASLSGGTTNQDHIVIRHSTGNVGIGVINPENKLEVAGTVKASDSLTGVRGEATATGALYGNYGGYFVAHGGYGKGVYDEATGSSGRGVSGKDTGSNGKGIDGYATGSSGIGVEGSATGSSGIAVYGYGADYDFYSAGPGTNYGVPSSIRWKRNIRPIDEPLDKVMNLRGVYFDWDAEYGGQHDVGMIAEEVGKVLPEIVNYESDGQYTSGMDYSKLTPLLVEAIKTLKTEMNHLKEENAELLDRLVKLEIITVKPAGFKKGDAL